MMENRVPILLAIVILLFALNVCELVYEGAAFSEYKGNVYEKTVNYNETVYTGTQDTFGITMFNPTVDIFVIDFPNMPLPLIMVFTFIQFLLIALIGIILVTMLLDALPFTGG